MNVTNTKLSLIKANPANPRVIKDGKFHKLVNSILALPKMLELRPIVTDAEMIVLGGNQRLRALEYIASMDDGELESRIRSISDVKKKSDSDIDALCLYWKQWKDLKTVPCAKADELTADEQRQFIIKDNASFGEWNWDMLANEFDNSELGDWGVDVWGAESESEDSKSENAEEDDFDEEKDEIHVVCRKGDVWQLGDHRLMCGDSVDLEQVKTLMGGVKADMWLTDPPYNVGYGMEDSAMMSKRKHRTDGLIVLNDRQDDSQFREFLRKAYSCAMEVLKAGCSFYIWHADSEGYNFRGALRDVGQQARETLIWNKNSLCLGRQDYQWKHEPCLYGWKEGAVHRWFNDRAQTTVLDFDRPKKSVEHPTMKPIPLFAYLIGNSTKPGEVVLDTFGGSGTTLIACEQLNRKCYMMELDPHYCDVIIARFEKLTGKKANKLN